MKLSVKSSGTFENIEKFLKRDPMSRLSSALGRCGEKGVIALKSATPIESGLTAAAWRYKVKVGKKYSTITWYNDHVNKNVNIAIILQYGHATGNGGWVEGHDYINPAIKPIFDNFASEIWMEVTRNG